MVTSLLLLHLLDDLLQILNLCIFLRLLLRIGCQCRRSGRQCCLLCRFCYE